jgi:hypothetical protein
MPNLFCNRYVFFALSYSILDAARQPSDGSCDAVTGESHNAAEVAPITTIRDRRCRSRRRCRMLLELTQKVMDVALSIGQSPLPIHGDRIACRCPRSTTHLRDVVLDSEELRQIGRIRPVRPSDVTLVDIDRYEVTAAKRHACVHHCPPTFGRDDHIAVRATPKDSENTER